MKGNKSNIKVFNNKEFERLDNIEKKPTKKELKELKEEIKKINKEMKLEYVDD